MPDTLPSKLRRLVRHLDELVASGDLAAVLVHLNDTYLIEARPPHLPGLARIARLIRFLKRYCQHRLGEDLVLTLHAGDLLSPSYLSNTRRFEGRQMVEALNACGLDVATLGNHEFDFGEPALLARMAEASFGFVMTNLIAPERYRIPRLVLWPAEAPFVAIVGIGGDDVRKKSVEHGFTPLDTEAALSQAIDEISADSRIGALVVLTHMDRDEDHAVVDMVRRLWPRTLCAYVLGGHDHDMNWFEPRGNTVFLKNLANGRSISIVPIRKSALVTVGDGGFQQYRSREHEIESLLRTTGPRVDIEAAFKAYHEAPGKLPALIAEAEQREREADLARHGARWPTVEAIRRSAMRAWLRRAPRAARHDHKLAFLRHIVAAIPRHDEVTLRRDAYDGLANETLISSAHVEAINDWREPWVIGSAQGLQALRQDPETLRIVTKWAAPAPAVASAAERSRVIFDESRNPERTPMDALETSLRTRSTNFGNFACDAIRAATGADLVLVHSGSFRGDETFEAALSVGNLIDTFLYDAQGALVEIQLSRREIGAIFALSATKSGSGAFLQSSDPGALPDFEAASCRVVISRYLLSRKSNDGYLDLIALTRGLEPAAAESALNGSTLADRTLIDLVVEGAGAPVYSEQQRIEVRAATLSTFERESALLVEPLRRFWEQARNESIRLSDALAILEGGAARTQGLSALRLQVWQAIRDLMHRQQTIRLDPQLLDYIARLKTRYVEDIAYDRLLETAWGFMYFTLEQDYLRKQAQNEER